MKYTYQHYLFADKPNRDLIMRDVFERLEAAEDAITQLTKNSQPLNRLAKGPKSWHPRFNGNDAS